jgi:hypothetical protein
MCRRVGHLGDFIANFDSIWCKLSVHQNRMSFVERLQSSPVVTVISNLVMMGRTKLTRSRSLLLTVSERRHEPILSFRFYLPDRAIRVSARKCVLSYVASC